MHNRKDADGVRDTDINASEIDIYLGLQSKPGCAALRWVKLCIPMHKFVV